MNLIPPFCSRKMWVISISILLFVLSPFLLLLFTSLLLLRHVLTLYKRIFHPELGPFFNGLDSILARASPYTGDPVTNVSFYMELDGHLQIKELRRAVQQGLDKMESEWKVGKKENGFRLKQYLTEWAGFILTADEPQFKIEDHVRMLDFQELSDLWQRQCPQKAQSLHSNSKLLEVIQQEDSHFNMKNTDVINTSRHWTEEELAQLAFELLSVPFKEKTSPWETLLLHNPPQSNLIPLKSNLDRSKSKETSVIIFRIHHSFTDGISLFSLFSHFLDQGQDFAYGKIINTFSSTTNKEEEPGGGGGFKSIMRQGEKILNDCAEAPRFINTLLKSWDDNIWHSSSISEARRRHSEAHGYFVPFEFPADRIRNIKGRYSSRSSGSMSMTTPTVILTAASLGIREYMIHHAKIPREDIPHFIHINTAVAQRRMRNEITNRFIFMPVQIPIGSASDSDSVSNPDPDPQKLMNRIQKEYLRMKNSSFTSVGPALFYLLGLLPTFVPLGSSCIFTTGTSSNNVVYENAVSIRGVPVLSTQALPSVPISDSFVLMSFCYNDRMKIVIGVLDEIVSSRREAQTLVKCIEKHLVHDL